MLGPHFLAKEQFVLKFGPAWESGGSRDGVLGGGKLEGISAADAERRDHRRGRISGEISACLRRYWRLIGPQWGAGWLMIGHVRPPFMTIRANGDRKSPRLPFRAKEGLYLVFRPAGKALSADGSLPTTAIEGDYRMDRQSVKCFFRRIGRGGRRWKCGRRGGGVRVHRGSRARRRGIPA